MKKLLAIFIFVTAVPYLIAAEKISLESDRLASFSPSIKVKSASSSNLSKSLPVNQSGSVSIIRRSELKKDRTEAIAKNQQAKILKFRPESAKSTALAFGFSIYSANTYLNTDLDGDGYYSKFTIDFDADFDQVESRDVYGIIYYSQNGGPWTEFFVTEVYSIFSDNVDDVYSVDSQLFSDFPSDEYDFLIDLYEDGFNDIVATFGPDDGTNQLFALPLEDEDHEVAITYVASDLSGDADVDGFYTDLTLEYDIETQYEGDIAYAEIIVTSRAQGWQQVLSSDNFTLGTQTEFIDLTFNSGYPAGRYDIELNIINVTIDQVVAEAGQEYASLVSLPIESLNNDNFYDGPPTHVDVVIHDSGSFGWSVILLGLIAVRKRKK